MWAFLYRDVCLNKRIVVFWGGSCGRGKGGVGPPHTRPAESNPAEVKSE